MAVRPRMPDARCQIPETGWGESEGGHGSQGIGGALELRRGQWAGSEGRGGEGGEGSMRERTCARVCARVALALAVAVAVAVALGVDLWLCPKQRRPPERTSYHFKKRSVVTTPSFEGTRLKGFKASRMAILCH
jgi:hypothetical protein